MGEATYYGTLYFPTQESASEALPRFRAFAKEVAQAYTWWQAHRFYPNNFWTEFGQAFPQVKTYLEFTGKWGNDHNNGLAGILDILESPEKAEEIFQDGLTIRWEACIWHCAQWSHLANYIQQAFQCKMQWVSEEEASLFDLLDHYEEHDL